MIRDFKPASAPPFSNPPSTPGVKWLKPNIVVQVAAMEVTENSCLRAPVFLRTRNDKEPRECTWDQIKGF
jgi:ATP-dependent DNA ligase